MGVFQKKVFTGALFCLVGFFCFLLSRLLRVIQVSTVTLFGAVALRSLKTLWVLSLGFWVYLAVVSSNDI